jgi:hypothetical protein
LDNKRVSIRIVEIVNENEECECEFIEEKKRREGVGGRTSVNLTQLSCMCKHGRRLVIRT